MWFNYFIISFKYFNNNRNTLTNLGYRSLATSSIDRIWFCSLWTRVVFVTLVRRFPTNSAERDNLHNNYAVNPIGADDKIVM